jgi:hypothetical protein
MSYVVPLKRKQPGRREWTFGSVKSKIWSKTDGQMVDGGPRQMANAHPTKKTKTANTERSTRL